jgi:hypothetical protein
LDFLGMLIAHRGHQLVTTAAAGTNTAVREGFERQGKQATVVTKNAFNGADHAVIYADQPLLERIKTSGATKDIHTTIIQDLSGLVTFNRSILVVLAKNAA